MKNLMKNLNKILIIFSSLCCFMSGLALADNSDCWIFWIYSFQQNWSTNWFTIVNQSRETQNEFTNFLTIDEQKAILTKNDLNTAILNLKKYCCNNEKWWLKKDDKTCTEDISFYNDNTLDSPYLFDHLFDVIMRRLNWLSGDNNIYTKTEMTVDNSWAERREFITDKALSSEWASVQSIKTKYNQFRKWQSEYYIADKIYNMFWSLWSQDFLKYVKNSELSDSIKNYNEWSLYNRYKNACALSEYFYALLNVSQTSTDKEKIRSSSCEAIIDRQIIWDNEYTSLVTKNASNLFLTNYIKEYINYLSVRQLNVENLWKSTTDRWLDVIRGVPCLQRKCTK